MQTGWARQTIQHITQQALLARKLWLIDGKMLPLERPVATAATVAVVATAAVAQAAMVAAVAQL